LYTLNEGNVLHQISLIELEPALYPASRNDNDFDEEEERNIDDKLKSFNWFT
jgi:hypothetical protein